MILSLKEHFEDVSVWYIIILLLFIEVKLDTAGVFLGQ